MINRQRVRRIKNVMYAFIVITFFLPLLLMIGICFWMMGLMGEMTNTLSAVVSRIETVGTVQPSDRESSGVITPASPAGSSIAPASSSQSAFDWAGQSAPSLASSSLPASSSAQGVGGDVGGASVAPITPQNGGNSAGDAAAPPAQAQSSAPSGDGQILSPFESETAKNPAPVLSLNPREYAPTTGV